MLDGGEGLDSLGESVVRIPTNAVYPGTYQPRRLFAEAELAELAESIKAHGVIQPIVVRPGAGGYELVVGERRWRAAQMAGLTEIPAVVRPMPDHEAALVALVENVQREQLHFLEEAEGYQRLLTEFGITQEELARRVGKSQPSIANKVRLLRLPQDVKDLISREMISERHARALLKLPCADKQREVLLETVKKGLTVKETEKLVELYLADIQKAPTQRTGGKQKFLKIYKDMRIFLNAFRQAVATLQASGVEAEMTQEESDDYLEIRVRIPRLQMNDWRAG